MHHELNPTALCDASKATGARLGGQAGGSRWRSQLPFWGLPHAALPDAPVPMTIGQNFALGSSFTAVQLIFINTGPVQPLGRVIVAPSARRSPGLIPVDAQGRELRWTEVTMGGRAPVLPAAESLARPWVGLSDIIALDSLQRTDGGAAPLLFTRTLAPTTGEVHPAIHAHGPTFNERYDVDSGGRGVECYVAAGDHVTYPAAAGGFSVDAVIPDLHLLYIAGIRFLGADKAITILGAGDSLTAGFVTESGFNGFPLQASVALARRGGLNVSYVAHGFPGQCTPDITANAMAAIDLLQPDIVTIPIDSPNDYTLAAPDQAAAVRSSMQERALELITYARRKSALPVLVTPIPFAAYDNALEFGALRVQSGDAARRLRSQAVMVLDAQAAICGYVPTRDRLPELPQRYRASDDAHLNDAGQAVIGAELARLLAPLCEAAGAHVSP